MARLCSLRRTPQRVEAALGQNAKPLQRDTNAGAVAFGGGVDARGFGWLGFRGEIRDVYTGPRNFAMPTPGTRVHSVVASGGLVLRF